jgi:hypothetical protein
MEPLMDIQEHHQLLAQIASEMWQASTTSIRYDVLEVIVEIFSETAKKSGGATRQIKERIKQHSLLVADTARGQALSFDHEDFQSFYLGEALGGLLIKGTSSELRTFLSVNLLPAATIEEAIQHIRRNKTNIDLILNKLVALNKLESGFSFCKDNCGAMMVPLIEMACDSDRELHFTHMVFPSNSLTGREIRNVKFDDCYFQPMSFEKTVCDSVKFIGCEFERIELGRDTSLTGAMFDKCRIDSLLLSLSDDDLIFDPARINVLLAGIGAKTSAHEAPGVTPLVIDDKLKIFQRFLKIFLRSTQADEEIVRVRLGKSFAPFFFDELLPKLEEVGVLDEVPWKGQGMQRRYKLLLSMSDIDTALEASGGNFEEFLAAIGAQR